MCAHRKVLHNSRIRTDLGRQPAAAPSMPATVCSPGAGVEFGLGACVDLEGEFVITDSDVVAVVEGGGRADPVVLYMHAVR
jgi:hypothetical protein